MRILRRIPSFLVLVLLVPAGACESGGATFPSTDLDGNGVVDSLDVLRFSLSWEATETDFSYDPSADFNRSGKVDSVDLLDLIHRWHLTFEATPTPTPGGYPVAWERSVPLDPPQIYAAFPESEPELLIERSGAYPAWDLFHTVLFFQDTDGIVHRAGADGTEIVSLGFSVIGGGVRPSYDASQIVYSVLAGSDFEIRMRDADGGNPRKVGGASGENWVFPTLGPDGRILFRRSSFFHSSIDGIWVVDPNSADPPTKYVDRDDVLSARWSPDGTAIAFHDEEAIYVMDAVPLAEPTLLVRMGRFTELGDWSPDGTQIVFASNASETSGWDVFVVPAAGGEPIPVTTDGSESTDVRPDW